MAPEVSSLLPSVSRSVCENEKSCGRGPVLPVGAIEDSFRFCAGAAPFTPELPAVVVTDPQQQSSQRLSSSSSSTDTWKTSTSAPWRPMLPQLASQGTGDLAWRRGERDYQTTTPSYPKHDNTTLRLNNIPVLPSTVKQQIDANDEEKPRHAVLGEMQLATFRTGMCAAHRIGKCANPDACDRSHCLTWQRRNPYEMPYRPELCPDIEFRRQNKKMNLTRRCARGRNCDYAHSKEEELYHPLVYKTKLCTSSPTCLRHFCPFAHSQAELRDPHSQLLIRTIWGSSIPSSANKGALEQPLALSVPPSSNQGHASVSISPLAVKKESFPPPGLVRLDSSSDQHHNHWDRSSSVGVVGPPLLSSSTLDWLSIQPEDTKQQQDNSFYHDNRNNLFTTSTFNTSNTNAGPKLMQTRTALNMDSAEQGFFSFQDRQVNNTSAPAATATATAATSSHPLPSRNEAVLPSFHDGSYSSDCSSVASLNRPRMFDSSEVVSSSYPMNPYTTTPPALQCKSAAVVSTNGLYSPHREDHLSNSSSGLIAPLRTARDGRKHQEHTSVSPTTCGSPVRETASASMAIDNRYDGSNDTSSSSSNPHLLTILQLTLRLAELLSNDPKVDALDTQHQQLHQQEGAAPDDFFAPDSSEELAQKTLALALPDDELTSTVSRPECSLVSSLECPPSCTSPFWKRASGCIADGHGLSNMTTTTESTNSSTTNNHHQTTNNHQHHHHHHQLCTTPKTHGYNVAGSISSTSHCLSSRGTNSPSPNWLSPVASYRDSNVLHISSYATTAPPRLRQEQEVNANISSSTTTDNNRLSFLRTNHSNSSSSSRRGVEGSVGVKTTSSNQVDVDHLINNSRTIIHHHNNNNSNSLTPLAHLHHHNNNNNNNNNSHTNNNNSSFWSGKQGGKGVVVVGRSGVIPPQPSF